ncbi:MAG: homocysteine S-methyltransferase family protein [Candidatus Eisenbacteria bacterium]|nr:homocysteine S-methyltransferase family protein [Candidatus Eisenbacteria bacterium]
MPTLLERLRSGEVLVCDGAMGTLLIARGLPPGSPPESVNLERPEVLNEIAQLYLDAGAQILETNTFGGSPAKLACYGLDGRMEEINRIAVEAVREVAGDRAWVAACCGPSGRMLKPYGDAEPAELKDGFGRQIRVLVHAGVDAIIIETMTDLAEAKLLVEAAREAAPGLPVIASMTFDPTPRGFFTIMGNSIEQAAAGLAQAGADVIGSNCGNGIEQMLAIARAYRAASERPIVIQSNAGLPSLEEGRPVYSETPEFMAARVPELIAAGAQIIGGCCGTTPEHIRAIRRAVDRAREESGR